MLAKQKVIKMNTIFSIMVQNIHYKTLYKSAHYKNVHKKLGGGIKVGFPNRILTKPAPTFIVSLFQLPCKIKDVCILTQSEGAPYKHTIGTQRRLLCRRGTSNNGCTIESLLVTLSHRLCSRYRRCLPFTEVGRWRDHVTGLERPLE